MNQLLQQLDPSPFKLPHTQSWKWIFVAVITFVCCGISLFCFRHWTFLLFEESFLPMYLVSVFGTFLRHIAHHMWAWTPSLVQTVTLSKLCTHMTKSNFLMKIINIFHKKQLLMKNITTSTELVCSELTDNEYSKITNLIWQANKLDKFWKGSLSKNRHSMLSEILPSLHLIPKKAQVTKNQKVFFFLYLFLIFYFRFIKSESCRHSFCKLSMLNKKLWVPLTRQDWFSYWED